ncbi:hypothetical protein M5D96_010390 [Drosophila gunungcola]|uniref:Inositol-pentakisphosphate 2-kinase n=1 Tax=Drosophila gunungcola TaxID=103775 RepID=A0A9Q0BMA1_9MUSC|nr:hypothetical protein M5D96_010390 [Drosophila gunungcola]
MTAARAPQAPPGVGQKLKLKPQFRFQFQFQPHRPAKNLHALLDLPAAMELRQIELIYRAEGNANLVLALPQFKKVLRLPKMISSGRRQEERDEQDEQDEVAGPEGQGDSSGGAGAEKAGDLTMPDFMAYIGIMRRLLGNEFVCGADIVAIPKEDDRLWINEHIRAQRPRQQQQQQQQPVHMGLISGGRHGELVVTCSCSCSSSCSWIGLNAEAAVLAGVVLPLTK